eukprot:UN25702
MLTLNPYLPNEDCTIEFDDVLLVKVDTFDIPINTDCSTDYFSYTDFLGVSHTYCITNPPPTQFIYRVIHHYPYILEQRTMNKIQRIQII